MNIEKSASKNKIILLIILMSGILLLYTTQSFLDEEQFSFITDSLFIIIVVALSIISSISAINKRKHDFSNKISSMFLSLGIISWAIAEILWVTLSRVYNEEPFPSSADIFYFLGYPLLAIFFMISIKSIKPNITKNTLTLSGIITFIFLIPTIIIFSDVSQDIPSLDIIVGITYPIIDSILVFFSIILLFTRFKEKDFVFWLLIFFVFILEISTDTFFLFTTFDDSYYNGHFTDALYLIAYTIFIFAIILQQNNAVKISSIKREINFEIMQKITFPLIIGSVFFIAITTVAYYSIYDEKISHDELLTTLTIIIFSLITIFSLAFFLMNKTIGKFIQIKTREIENQVKDLEILLEKKTEEIVSSAEFSNLGYNLTQIVHDLKNPLAVIKSNIDLLENSELNNPVLSGRIKSMKDGINLMTEQIQDILNYIKKPTITYIDTTVHRLIDNSLKNMNIPKRIKINYPESDVKISCDESRMTLVLINILDNAIDAMSGEGQISIKTKKDKTKVQIQISNTGPEIPEEEFGKIFEPLYTTKSKGTGLGLATCLKIINQHEGSISIKNNPTTFIIEFPNREN